MKKYKVYYKNGLDDESKIIECNNILDLVIKLDGEILYRKQFNSVYKIEVC